MQPLDLVGSNNDAATRLFHYVFGQQNLFLTLKHLRFWAATNDVSGLSWSKMVKGCLKASWLK